MRGVPMIVKDGPRPGVPSSGCMYATVTGTALTQLVPQRQGAHAVLYWLMVTCTNATTVTVTIIENGLARWTVTLNANAGWWWEVPLPPKGLELITEASLQFQLNAAGATVEAHALVDYLVSNAADEP